MKLTNYKYITLPNIWATSDVISLNFMYFFDVWETETPEKNFNVKVTNH